MGSFLVLCLVAHYCTARLTGHWQCDADPAASWAALRTRHAPLEALAVAVAPTVERRELWYRDWLERFVERLPPRLEMSSQWAGREPAVLGLERRVAVTLVVGGTARALEFEDIDGATQLVSFRVQDEAPVAAADSEPLVVCSYNVWHFTEPYTMRLERLRALLSDQKCDVLVMQEVRYRWVSGAPEQRWQLAHLLPADARAWHWSRAMTYLGEGGFRHDEGLAWIVRGGGAGHARVVGTSTLTLSRNYNDPDDAHQRVLLRVSVRVGPAGPVLHVFVTHMSLSISAQRRNALEIWRELQRHSGPQLLVGDLNGTPQEAMYRFFTGREQWDGARGDMVDVWTHSHSDADSGNTFFAWDPHKRIDFMLMRNHGRVLRAGNATLFGRAARKADAASDHMGMRAVVHVTGGDGAPPPR